MAEDWKLQVSYKTPAGDMINVRAQTADELSVLLESMGDYSTQIAAVQRLVVGAYNVAPLATAPTTVGTGQFTNSAPPQAQAPSAMGAPAPVTQGGPTCQHGPRKFKSGISSKTGNPYSMWVCPMPQGADQCKPVN
jgi:hypothetical protein